MQQHNLPVTRTARFYSLGQISEKTRFVWIVCHGYGQLAQYFIRNFTGLEDPETVIIAPEALSRFYLNGTSGRIGATWMTSEDRLNEISDYINYLENLLSELRKQLAAEAKIFVLGFSQGVATACRWVAKSKFAISGLVLWAGSFPLDLANPENAKPLLQMPFFVVSGTQDPYATPDVIGQQTENLANAGLQPQFYSFNGRHEIEPGLLQKIHLQLTGNQN